MRYPWPGWLALISLVALAGCGAAPSLRASDSPASPAALSLLIEPDAGMGAIDALLGSAQHSVDLTMYELDDAGAEQSLAGDAARGANVRVILDSAYTGSANDAAYSYLQARGVHVHWAASLYAIAHQKTLVVDSSVGVIMTLNWTRRYYADTRDVAVVDRTPSDIAAIRATFDADYNGTRIDPAPGADLVWSPTTSLPDLLALIKGATRALSVENEEMDNPKITAALIAAARRGVHVEVCMTDSSGWSSAFRELTTAGVHLRVYSPRAALYIHAKVLVRDPGASDQAAFAGSQNFSTESLRYNRELGVILHAGTAIGQLQAMIQRDYSGATSWTG